ncbi:MAG: transcription antitermination factor NusB [Ignavibacteria bacterium]|nr:transcription antitermination factor NusB [Ignavibacteria bacterium]MBT8382098.1 transcription antitermination factor NusB [Ignavibacteria bacterium]MBT8392010.1 transcription antitermination factor NusB [Ignavibacteria bacterium]
MAKKSKRRIIREKVLQILYAYELNKESLTSFSAEVLKDVKDEMDKDFARALIRRVLANVEELDSKIKGRVENWELNRIALIDKILLRMGICELLHFPDIPPKVSINESIEIAKDYSTAGSGKFINGILDAILAEQKKSGKLNKVGRGLVEESLSREKNTSD